MNAPRLIIGDCIEALNAEPENSVDAVVTDPPYGLEFMGKDWDSFGAPRSASTAGRVGDGAQTAGGAITGAPGERGHPAAAARVAFGGQRPTTNRCTGCGKRDQFRNAHPCADGASWKREPIDPESAPPAMLGFQRFCEAWARACYRVLKPGGHLLAFGGSRTYHRMACAIEDAGFEVRDQLMWLYGQGFPKSMDIAKAMDRHVGVEGTFGDAKTEAHQGWIDRGTIKGADSHDGWRRPSQDDPEAVDRQAREYFPASPEAEQWDGWGTALKPAHEPIVLARKPLGENSVAANLLVYCTGALNIDGCRIGTEGGTRRDGKADTPNAAGWENMKGHDIAELDAGRWPANVMMSHHDECVTQPIEVVIREADLFHAEQEVVTEERWLCHPDCPRSMLDRQSGDAGGGFCRTHSNHRRPEGYGMGGDWNSEGYGDSGGASRFFKTIEWDPCNVAPTGPADESSSPDEQRRSSVPSGAATLDAPAVLPPVQRSPERSTNGTPNASSKNGASGTHSTPSIAERCSPEVKPVDEADQHSPAASVDGRLPIDITDTAMTIRSTSSGSVDGATSGNMPPRQVLGDPGFESRAKFIYCPKASTAERNAGLEHMPAVPNQKWNEGGIKAAREETARPQQNVHPTVKPIDVMRYLIRLVAPMGATVLDPFLGSGTTAIAAIEEGCTFVGVEKNPEYSGIILARLAHHGCRPHVAHVVPTPGDARPGVETPQGAV